MTGVIQYMYCPCFYFVEFDYLYLVCLALNFKVVSATYLTELYSSPTFFLFFSRWYFGKVSRNASEEWLLHPGLQKGTFLIRQGEALPGKFGLKVIPVFLKTNKFLMLSNE